MKMYELVELTSLYNSIKDIKLPLKTTYKFSRLMKRAEEEVNFYQEKFNEIIEEYGLKENGEYKLTPDKQSIVIIPGKESECMEKMRELKELEIDIDISFTIEELENLDLTVSQFNYLFPLINN